MKRRKLRLHVTQKSEPQASVHPIVEAKDAHYGLTELKIRDANGHRIGFLQVLSSELDDELCDALTAWRARHACEGDYINLVKGDTA